VRSDADGAATVKSVAFLGPISRVYVELADGSVLHAQMPTAQAQRFGLGTPVSVGVEQTQVLVVPG
jgi:putative spermidine/putrescine transport system ATP-binding protein